MSHQKKRLNQQAQHLIEYSVLIILVLAGIIIAGPYVIRSWNARVKSWDDSVTESMQDPLLEAPPDTVTIPGCDPDPAGWINQGCQLGGLGIATCLGQVNCAETQRLETLTYMPLGCECSIKPVPPTARCVYEACCCTTAVSTALCGVNATNPPDPDRFESVCAVFDQMSDTNPDGTCPDGYLGYYVYCGNDDTNDPNQRRYGCISDPACVFDCTGPIVVPPPQYGTLCTDSNGIPDDQRLSADTPRKIVATGGCTDGTAPANKCEYECRYPFVPMGGGTYCDCPTGTTYNAGTNNCDCDPNLVKECPTNPTACYRGPGPLCAANECSK